MTEHHGVMLSTTPSCLGIPGLNPSPEAGYSDLNFLRFSSVHHGKCWDNTTKQTMATYFHVLSNSSLTIPSFNST
jgi:hypothetical protein